MKKLLVNMRILFAILVLGTSVAAQIFTPEQYAKALWMSTRFLGAQRSGAGPNWILQDSEYPQSFVKDKYQGRDISGGWFDCGDHVMFGQTQFYSSYMIAKAMSLFPLAWHDNYNGTTYSDYKKSGDYTMAGGQPNGLPDVLEELRYAADFIVKATPNPSTFIMQKGNPSADHRNWVTAGRMAQMTKAHGGESDSARQIVVNPDDALAPGLAAATLAIMARHDPDSTRRNTYLQHALYAYYYSQQREGVQSSTPASFYQKGWWDERWREGRNLAALELFATTGDSAFWKYAREDVQYVTSGMHNRLEYTNVIPVLRAMVIAKFNYSTNWMIPYLDTLRSQVNSEGVTVAFTENNNYFTRSPAGAAASHALYSVYQNLNDYDDFIIAQIDYILGKNSGNQSYLVGWTETDVNGNVKKDASKPHHRGYFGNTDVSQSDASFNQKEAPVKNRLLGGLVGGAPDGSYDDNLLNWRVNEVCTDMNATFLLGLAYVVQKLYPAEQSIPVQRVAAPKTTLKINTAGRRVEVNAGQSVRIYDLRGKMLWQNRGERVIWEAPQAGIYVIQVQQAGQVLRRQVALH